MIKSMTGFGHAEKVTSQCKITVELKSVNHRYLDLNIKMPRRFNMLEGQVRNLLKQYMQRGKVDVFITYEDYISSDYTLKYNKDLAAEYLRYLNQMAERRFVITPHMKEMSRLTGTPVEELKADRIQILKDFISRYRITCVLKDSRTLIASEEKGIRMNLTGNSAMAKAGSGDVLAGVISGWMVQGKEAEDAAELGTYIHGLSGDLAKFEKGVYSVMARDLIEYISKALMKLEEE